MTTTSQGLMCETCHGQQFGFVEDKGIVCTDCEKPKKPVDMLLREIFIKFGDKNGNKNY